MTEMLVEKKQNKYYGLSEISYFLDEGEKNIDDYYWVFAQCRIEDAGHRKKLEALIQKQRNSLLSFHGYLLLASSGIPKDDKYEQILSEANDQIKKLEEHQAESEKPAKKDQKEKQKPEAAKPAKKEEAAEAKNVSKKATKEKDVDAEWEKKVAETRFVRKKRDPPVPSADRRNMLITAALPYVNNEPHLGNLIGAILSADCFSRYCRLRGYNTFYICGTDEHGSTTEVKALMEKKTPKEICDQYYTLHSKIYEDFDIDFDYFGRTSCDVHKTIVKRIFDSNDKNGYVLSEAMKQLYCAHCQMFLADRYVNGTCPKCSYEKANGDQCDKCQNSYEAYELKDPKCTVCKGLTEVRESKQLFLDLTKLEGQIKEYTAAQIGSRVWSNNSVGITSGWFNMGLKPKCISRDLKWGVPVSKPGFEGKCFYVWYDAPIGYISISAEGNPQWEKWWLDAQNVELSQFMGKDNVFFHTIFFPGIQLAAGEKWKLMDHISTTEYLNYEGTKFSKSNGTGIFGSDVRTTNIPIDYWRFYLLHIRPETSDTDFKWDDFQRTINEIFMPNIGNFCQRVLKYLYSNNNKRLMTVCKDKLDDADREVLQLAWTEFEQYLAHFESFKIKEALKSVCRFTERGNKYVQTIIDSKIPKEQALNKIALASCLVRMTATM